MRKNMTIGTLSEHHVLQNAYQVSLQTGVRLYLVGGAVRDALSGGRAVRDMDFAVEKRFADVTAAFARTVKGKAVPWDRDQTRVVFRRDGIQVSVDFSLCKGGDIERDLARRDFTINAMAVDVQGLFGQAPVDVIDPMGGRRDLERKIIRCCSRGAFDDDPLRVLRGIRFAGEQGATISPQTAELMHRKAPLITTVARERVKRELFSIFNLPGVRRSVEQLRRCGIMEHLVPELEAFDGFTQGEPHQYTLLEHSLRTVDALEKILECAEITNIYKNNIIKYLNEEIEQSVTRRSLLMFAGMLHDSGKPSCARKMSGKMTCHGHDGAGAILNAETAQRLGLGKHARRIVTLITGRHMRLLQLSLLEHISERAKTRFLRDAGECVPEILLLGVADARATGSTREHESACRAISELVRELLHMHFAVSPDRSSATDISGKDVMDVLDMPEGPDVGAILCELADRERAGLIASREDALQWLKKRKRLS